MALFITEKQVSQILNVREAFTAVRQAHLDLFKGTAFNTPRTRSRSGTMTLHTLSASSSTLGRSIAKVYSSTKDSIQSHVLLYDNTDGRLLSIIEANELGRYRTAAASLVAAKALSPSNPQTLGIIGTGYQGEALIRAFLSPHSGFPLKKVYLYRRNTEKLSDLCKDTSQKYNIEVTAASSIKDLTTSSDIVITATTSSKPVIDESCISAIKHISAIGSNSLARRELSPRIVTSAKSVVVDSIDTARMESGNLLSPIENGKLHWNQVIELGTLLAGGSPLPDPPGNSSLTIFCSHGLAVQDLYLAAIVEKAVKTQKTVG